MFSLKGNFSAESTHPSGVARENPPRGTNRTHLNVRERKIVQRSVEKVLRGGRSERSQKNARRGRDGGNVWWTMDGTFGRKGGNIALFDVLCVTHF